MSAMVVFPEPSVALRLDLAAARQGRRRALMPVGEARQGQPTASEMERRLAQPWEQQSAGDLLAEALPGERSEQPEAGSLTGQVKARPAQVVLPRVLALPRVLVLARG